MKTLEELRGMSQEELVTYALELQKEVLNEKKEHELYKKWWHESIKSKEDFKNVLVSVVELLK